MNAMNEVTKSHRSRTGAVILVTSALVLSACSGGNNAGDSEGDGGSWKPDGQITMISAFGSGGGTDKVARAMLEGLEACDEGVTGNIEYHEGGSGVIGYSHFQQQRGDTTVMATTTELTTLPMFVDTSFTWEAYTPIAHIADDQVSLAVPANSPMQSLRDLVEAAKTRNVTIGVVGLSGPDNVARALLEKQGGVKFEPVIFDGGGETTSALLGNDIDAAIGGAGDIVGQVESGDVRGLAIFGPERYTSGVMAEVPTAKEQGYDIAFTQWRGLLGTGDMSDEARDWYADCMEKWQDTPSYQNYLESALTTQAYSGPSEFSDMLKEQDETVHQVLEESGAFGQ
ncbi:tripartite tricarboxylate transporter substrate binding protein [Mycobacterium neglectum]|uniref:tripartite tricarboxylate transporter substrate binding protein n=1 Tax=Mycobacterium neglectum TaxID=242737 RepID=UPI000BFEFF76|nr:tripartite tricarboxylate transporter substrate binding protein [Mycobacterium neglectum]